MIGKKEESKKTRELAQVRLGEFEEGAFGLRDRLRT